MIELNGQIEFYRNASFAAYLAYFIDGPDLPASLIAAFESRINDCYEPLNGTDALEIAKFSRRLCREHGLNSGAAEDFYKLALECLDDPRHARTIRDHVKQMR